ncbi:sugar ABC transporter ATP-binding protein [Agromyces marinus]|uniref:Ribose import ATP-binding protein RbsA 1 n=1 Tax=Agromyces marinus TaxID=1389020 RepID=A0ABM8H0F7_9MICO|nr:sugar ABC transporter ATP-binding protein [Agromyces marinus]UIP57639.1 Galactose/methyl galactoside import ATP-binding protein MglA [Agromyces marinus]BDZ54206.1 ribose import ATP-binding protein RbsA 1 [Agromyces marinus]
MTGAPARDLDGEPVLVAEGLRKSFFGVTVLDDVSLTLRPGEVHGLVGENGAGKSTVMKILAGVHQADAGRILLGGRPVSFTHPVQAAHAGLATVFQEFNLLPERSIAQNVFLGREPRRRGFVDRGAMRRRTRELLDDLGIRGLDVDAPVRTLTVAEQQVVEIVKALSTDARVIQMDEPTAALADHEVELLYTIVRRLSERGVAIIYVSHRLREIFDLCDTITVLKDGVQVSTGPASELDTDELVRRMVGRPISAYYPEREPGTGFGEPRLVLQGSGNGQVDGVDLELRAGEIVGIAGLQGSGRTELVEGVFGIAPFTRGRMLVDGRPVRVTSARQAVRLGIALVTEDRKAQGLALNQSILDNALLVIRSVFARRTGTVRRELPGVLTSLEVVSRGTDQEVQYLSGGNQQKVVLAKWLATGPRIVLFDEPTRGIDVGAKVAVYTLMRRLAKDGVAIVMISSELPEVIGMSDRIIVMHDGRASHELPPRSDEATILAAATGTLAPAIGADEAAEGELR